MTRVKPKPRKTPVPPGKWKWQGYGGHFICADMCRFRMTTIVGRWIVSTVGDYYPPLPLGNGPKEIGYKRTHETMVFLSKPVDGCGCREMVSGAEEDAAGYNSHNDATNGHYAMCRKWARFE